MVIGSKNSKVFHYPNCRHAKRIKPNNIIYFKDKDEARISGYYHCTHCSRIIRYYNEDKENIDSIIQRNNMQMYIEDDSMYIDNTFSCWKISVSSKGYDLWLYHANSESYHKLQKKDGHIIHHYHTQKYKGKKNIISMLEYIVEHDKWKREDLNRYKTLPKDTKKQRQDYNRARKSNKRVMIRNVCNILDKIKYEEEEKLKHKK